MTDKHTPGPWRFSPSEYRNEYVLTGSDEHGGHVLPIIGRTHNWPKRAEANARMMAAAPDLLEALKAVNKLISEAAMTGFNWKDGDWPERLYRSQQATSEAIRKAEGRELRSLASATDARSAVAIDAAEGEGAPRRGTP